MTREAVAVALGKSLSTVVRWESEQTSDPRLSELLAMEKLKPGLIRRLIPKNLKAPEPEVATENSGS
jgi:hypothetical protein